MTRRELFKHSAKVAWVAPTVTPLFAAQLQPRWALQMYKARFVQKTSSGQRYADVCDAECREWFHDNVPDFLQDVGGYWAVPTRDGF